MSKEKQALAERIVEGLGGAGNIVTFENCMTRLRVVVRDGSKVDREDRTPNRRSSSARA